jgi:ABC-type uncharacterized transport system auxiliary subunit
MKKTFFLMLSICALFISSCSITKPIQSDSASYIIKPNINIKKQKTSFNKTVEVKVINCSNRFNSNLFYYRLGKYQFLPYSKTRWVDSICKMLKISIIDALNQSNIFKYIKSNNMLIAEDYKLLVTINDFEPVFEKKKNFILLDADFVLLNKQGTICEKFRYKEKLKIKTISIKSIVALMNNAAQDMINSIIQHLSSKIE